MPAIGDVRSTKSQVVPAGSVWANVQLCTTPPGPSTVIGTPADCVGPVFTVLVKWASRFSPAFTYAYHVFGYTTLVSGRFSTALAVGTALTKSAVRSEMAATAQSAPRSVK